MARSRSVAIVGAILTRQSTYHRMHRLLLALILLAGLAIRVWNNDYGLPYVWSLDEGTHFADRAVEMFRDCLLYTSPSPRDRS